MSDEIDIEQQRKSVNDPLKKRINGISEVKEAVNGNKEVIKHKVLDKPVFKDGKLVIEKYEDVSNKKPVDEYINDILYMFSVEMSIESIQKWLKERNITATYDEVVKIINENKTKVTELGANPNISTKKENPVIHKIVEDIKEEQEIEKESIISEKSQKDKNTEKALKLYPDLKKIFIKRNNCPLTIKGIRNTLKRHSVTLYNILLNSLVEEGLLSKGKNGNRNIYWLSDMPVPEEKSEKKVNLTYEMKKDRVYSRLIQVILKYHGRPISIAEFMLRDKTFNNDASYRNILKELINENKVKRDKIRREYYYWPIELEGKIKIEDNEKINEKTKESKQNSKTKKALELFPKLENLIKYNKYGMDIDQISNAIKGKKKSYLRILCSELVRSGHMCKHVENRKVTYYLPGQKFESNFKENEVLKTVPVKTEEDLVNPTEIAQEIYNDHEWIKYKEIPPKSIPIAKVKEENINFKELLEPVKMDLIKLFAAGNSDDILRFLMEWEIYVPGDTLQEFRDEHESEINALEEMYKTGITGPEKNINQIFNELMEHHKEKKQLHENIILKENRIKDYILNNIFDALTEKEKQFIGFDFKTDGLTIILYKIEIYTLPFELLYNLTKYFGIKCWISSPPDDSSKWFIIFKKGAEQ